MWKLTTCAALSALAISGPADGQSTHEPPAMVSVQPELLGMPGSLSNAWADFDGDGDFDLAVTLKSGEIRLYRNDGGRLESVGAELGLPTGGHEFRAISWGDYDNDGRIDLFAGSSIREKPSALYRNTADGFVDVAADVGLLLLGRASRQNNWIDYDNDGDVDLFATDRSGENKLYRNDGGLFAQVFANAGPTSALSTVGACWLDYDRDGDLDLFLANQSGKPDALWRNDGERFVDVADELGMSRSGRSSQEGGVGCAVGDFNNDGYLDIFVPNYGPNSLWQGTAEGGFIDAGPTTGVAVENHAVGAAWGDWDNDGFADLSVMSYEGPSNEQVPHNSLFRNLGGQSFANVLPHESPLNAGDHGVTWVDYDRDGDVDLSITKGYTPVGGHYLFRNELDAAAARQSLSVLVLDEEGRYNQAGAEVRVYGRNGKLLGTGQVSTGGGYGSQGAVPVHFGLPTAKTVTVEVTFMSPSGRKVQKIEEVEISRYHGRDLVVRRQT